jgi:hypothetical protein
MGRRVTITINQVERDPDFKSMIHDLRSKEDHSNPYRGRSESEIVKMILKEFLIAEHQRICNDSPPRELTEDGRTLYR